MTWQELKELDLNEVADWPRPMQWLLVVLVCGALVAAAYYLLLKDQQQQLQRLQLKEQTLRGDFERQQKRAANLPHYRAQLETMQASFGSMLRQLPDQTEVADLLVDVSQAGLAVGLEFVLFQPEKETAQNFYAELPIKLRVLGRYHQFGEFVSDLAALPRIVTLHDVVIRAQKNSQSANGLLVMEATAKTYRYLDKAREQ